MFLTYEDQYLKATIVQHDKHEPDVFVEWKIPLADVIRVEAYGRMDYNGHPHVQFQATLPEELHEALSWLTPGRMGHPYDAVRFTAESSLTPNRRLRTKERQGAALLEELTECHARRAAKLVEELARNVSGRFEYQARQFTQYVERACIEGTWKVEESDAVLDQLRRDAEAAQKLADAAHERAKLAHKQVRARRAELIRAGLTELPLPSTVADHVRGKLDEYTKESPTLRLFH